VRPEVSIVAASGETKKLGGAHAAPGLYETTFPLETYGEFVRLRVDSKVEGSDAMVTKNYAVVESFPPEYRAAAPDRAFLQHAADSTKGKVEPAPADAFTFVGDPARGLRDLWRLLVLVAGILLPLDIALRRLS